MKKSQPNHYLTMKESYPEYFESVEKLGEVARSSGPLDKKTAHLVQLGAAVASKSEGATHSHTRRLLEMGVAKEEIIHAIMILVSTIGFPAVMAGISWANDVIEK